MSDELQPLAAEGFTLMAAAFEVHNVLGGGLSEEIYQESLEIELTTRSIPFQRKEELKVYYKQRLLNKRYVPDLVVHGMVVELKAVSKLLPEHEAQLLNYMRIARRTVGYLINFGPIGKLQWKRFVLSGH